MNISVRADSRRIGIELCRHLEMNVQRKNILIDVQQSVDATKLKSKSKPKSKRPLDIL